VPDDPPRLTWVWIGDRHPALNHDPDHFVALDGEAQIGIVRPVAVGPDCGSWMWSLLLPPPGPAFTGQTRGLTLTRKEAARELLTCWRACYRTGDEGGEP
jgi:hypothetical protein